MKIIKIVLLTILVIDSFWLILTFSIQNNVDALLGKEKVYYALAYKSEESPSQVTETISEWQEFAQKNHLIIGTTFFNDEKSILIYQTAISEVTQQAMSNINNNKQALEKTSLTNYKDEATIKIPSSLLKMEIVNFYQIQNNGLPSEVFIEGSPKEIKAAKNFLSNYAEVKKIDESPTLNFIGKYTLGIIIFAICLLLYLFALYYTVELNAKKIAIVHIFSKDSRAYYFQFFKSELYLQIIAIMIAFALIALFSTLLGDTNSWEIYFDAALSYLMVLLLSFLISMIFIRRKSQKVFLNTNSYIKGQKFVKKLSIINLVSMLALFVVILIAIGFSFQNYNTLKQELSSLKTWERAKNIYQLNYQDHLKNGDIKGEYFINLKLVDLYKELVKEKKGFIVDASNFMVLQKDPYKFLFEENIRSEQDAYGMNGNSITIDENYLLHNPIHSSKVNINEKMIHDDNTLNILVPEKLKEKEEMIKNVMLDDFFEQKVNWKNSVYKKIDVPQVNTQKEDLNINIIYVDNQQKYFTFTSSAGVPENQYSIIDPIAVLLNPSISELLIGSYITSSTFISDASQTHAYQNLVPTLQKTGTKEYITSTQSVYSQVGNQIEYLESSLKTMVSSIFVFVCLSWILAVYQVHLYYKIYEQKISIQVLTGKSILRIYRSFLIKLVSALLVILIIVSLYFNSLVIFGIGVSLVLLETLLGLIQGNVQYRKTVNHLIKR
ncbi:DUF1430 domain-containing protein [Listeria ilorinensis]|uniref:DUF1430 domain-containing protein n=1 Tax=Listeria ilorinensis TaxID=2867439 RepID=UPI001EF46BDC|nr:DUF1430 domain-containing protein [Listeria ilorinensis]